MAGGLPTQPKGPAKIPAVARFVTGYYGIPGKSFTKVHVADHKGPLCRSPISPENQFQWCSNGINVRYLECMKCRRIVNPILIAEREERDRKWRKSRRRW